MIENELGISDKRRIKSMCILSLQKKQPENVIYCIIKKYEILPKGSPMDQHFLEQN